MRFWQKATQQPWAITQPALTTILDIAARNNEDPDIVAAKLGRDLNNAYAIKPHEGVMEIPITGPLFRYANLFTLISGATSYERITQDIQAALANDDIGAIILNIDSPGGEVNGCSELAQLIFNARGTKPIIAYASGDCASGAYWIASACDRIVAADTASLGSIGVVAMVDQKDNDDTTLEFVSSQSPHKRLDLNTDADQQRLQERVDALAQVFIDRVALHRGVDGNTVQSEFGQGGTFIGQHAVTAGLADEVGTFDGVMMGLTIVDQSESGESSVSVFSQQTSPQGSSTPKIFSSERTQDAIMDLEQLQAAHPTLCQQLIDQGAAQATQRIADVLSCEAADTHFPLAKHLALNTTLAVDVVKQTLGVLPVHTSEPVGAQENADAQGDAAPALPVATALTDFAQAMAAAQNPVIVPTGEDAESGDTEEAIAKRIAECAM